MRRWKALAACCAVALAASLALARVHPFGDAGLYGAKAGRTPLVTRGEVPAEVRAVLSEKCADCHSDETQAPLYGHFAPASWLMERDILEGRRAMNLSLWDTYSADKQQTLAAQMAQETKSRGMPPVQYRLIHWEAHMAVGDVQALGSWARGMQGGKADAAGAGAGDAARGKALFEKRCTGCHALTENHEGPRLQGVYGRVSGTAAGFAYSGAVKKAGIVWDDRTLDGWLTDPDAFIPGNDMDFLVSRPQERLDLIRYLKQDAGK